MISFVNGLLADVDTDQVVIDVGGIGYQIFVSLSTLDMLPAIGESLKLYTFMSVKEDGVSLFGFPEKDDLKIFKLLITVSGIGPKGALSVLSTLSPDDLRFAILAGDSKAISRAPGVGKKTAERIVLDLHDKISNDDITGNTGNSGSVSSLSDTDNETRNEAVQALIALGYNSVDSLKAVRKVIQSDEYKSNMATEDLLRYALKEIF